MPTLIRLIVVLLILGGLGFGAMLGLVMTVHPTEKDVTIRIPSRDLLAQQNNVERRVIDTSGTATGTPAAPATDAANAADAGAAAGDESADAAPSEAMPPPQPDDNSPDVQTLAPGTE